MAKEVKYMGDPDACDICQQSLVADFVDGKTKQGPWGNMCLGCHARHGVGLGIGKGQHYKKTQNEWIKIA